jgi:ligand-binding sensor domain-containing protein/serine phosphatase RsbU (regulator of sigma subunit)
MRVNRLIPLIILFLLGTVNSIAQQYNIKIFSTKNGLANSIVNHIILDKKGYLWFATQGGLSRFDGKNFVNYTTKNGLPGNDITYLAEDLQGNLWVAAYGSGISRFDGATFTNYTDKNGLTNLNVYNIFCDSKGVIWLTTRGGGIFSLEGDKFSNFSIKDSLPTDQFLSVCEDKQGRLWFGTKGEGLISYDRKDFRIYNEKDGLSHKTIASLSLDKKGNLWIGNSSGIPNVFSNGEFKALQIPEIKGDLISSIIEDDRGNIWIASEHGLVKYSEGKYKIYAEQNGLPSNAVYSICQDYEGNIWIGTSNGVGLFKNEAFIAFTDKEGLSNPKVTAIFQNKEGTTFVGTSGGGLNILDDDKVRIVKDVKELLQANILAILEDRKGKLWIGLESSQPSLLVLEKSGNGYRLSKTVDKTKENSINTVSRIIEDSKGRIWISSYGAGVVCFDGDEKKEFDVTNGLPTNDIFTLIEDTRGNIWMGTYLGGLVKYDGKKFEIFNEKSGLPDNTVYSLANDKNGNLIIGTQNKGLAIYNGQIFRSLSTSEGLCSDIIYSIVSDSKNRIWIGTDKGVNRISLDRNFNITGIKFYSENDGLKSIEVNQSTFLIDKSNKIWFGTTNGLIRYNPNYDYINDNPPLLQLTGIKLFFEDIDWKRLNITVPENEMYPVNPSLSYKDNHLTFNFQALTTDNVQYTYILEGQDANWSPLTLSNEAVYTNIPPGKYTFRVKAKNSDEAWSSGDTSFSFVITPPFWKTWWFYVLVGTVVLISIISFIRWRTAKLQHEKRILEERVNQRTIALSKANNQLSVAFNDIKDSINYAKRIQDAILPLENEIYRSLPEHFILFKPRDVVSGDFYWFNRKGDRVYIAACDCTGHGVPGAFMSIIGTSLLNEIISEFEDIEPGDMLGVLRHRLMFSLKQTSKETESKDGMDMVFCCIDLGKNTISFAGANNPFYYITNGELKEFKGDKQPIGVYGHELKPFRTTTFTYNKGDIFYIFTDGYPDQFGGPKGKKFLYTRFKETLFGIHTQNMEDQHKSLQETFQQWRGEEHEQVDDVLVIGVRL